METMPRSTVADVAARANVSVATVSRVFSGRDRVSAELESRVREVAAELGYRPNSIARSLRTNSTLTVALVIPDISNPYFMQVARGVDSVLNPAGYSVVLCNTDENLEREQRYFENIEEQRMAGMILAPQSSSPDFDALLSNGLPMVIIDRSIAADVDMVLVRSADAAKAATEHLLSAGWRRPAIITGPTSASTAMDRLQGYLAAIADTNDHDTQPHDPIIAYTDFSEQESKAATLEFLARPIPPDSLLVAGANMAIGAISAIEECGLQVGRDIGLVTFDDPSWARYLSPSVSAVVQPADEVGSIAAKMLLAQIGESETVRSQREPQVIWLDAELVPRESSLRRIGD